MSRALTPAERAFEGLRAAERAAADAAWDAMARALPGWGEALVALRRRAGDRLVCADLRVRRLDTAVADPFGSLLRWTPDDLDAAREVLVRAVATLPEPGTRVRLLEALGTNRDSTPMAVVLGALREAASLARVWLATEPSSVLRDDAAIGPVAMRFVFDDVNVKVVVAEVSAELVVRAVATREDRGVAGVTVRWEARAAAGTRCVDGVTDEDGVLAGIQMPSDAHAEYRLHIIAGAASAELRWSAGGT